MKVLEKGFTFAMPWKMKSLQLNEARMPNHIQDGQPMQIVNLSKVEEFTKPPDFLQESELISLMDKHGIGLSYRHLNNLSSKHLHKRCSVSY